MKPYSSEWWAEVRFFVWVYCKALLIAMCFVMCVLAVLARLDGAW